MLLILSSILLMYEFDALIIAVYLFVTISVFASLTILERTGYQAHKDKGYSFVDEFVNKRLKSKLLMKVLGQYVILSISLMFLAVSILSVSIPSDIGYLSVFLLISSLMVLVLQRRYFDILAKLLIYVTVALIVYLDYVYVDHGQSVIGNVELFIYVTIALAIILLIKFDDKAEFEVSPMDYLVAIVVIIAFTMFSLSPEKSDYGQYIVKLVLLFYGCELIAKRNIFGFKVVSVISLLTLSVIACRMFLG